MIYTDGQELADPAYSLSWSKLQRMQKVITCATFQMIINSKSNRKLVLVVCG